MIFKLNTNLDTVKTMHKSVSNQTVNVASGTSGNTTITVLTAPQSGLYFIEAVASYGTNANGFRRAGLSTQMSNAQLPANEGYPTSIVIEQAVYVGAGTNVVLNLMQNSGSTLAVTVNAKYSYIPLD